MQLDPKDFLAYLSGFQFERLFNELGWDRAGTQPHYIDLGDNNFVLSPVAQKRGVTIFRCSPDSTGAVPQRPTLLKVEKEAGKLAHEHLIIFTDAAQTVQTWLWVSRMPGQPVATRSHTWHKGTSGEALRQKLEHIAFALDEEESITLTLASQRLRDAFDRDRVTKAFYSRFAEEHAQFSDFISGIKAQANKQWYASLMLNRLMFVYFIQKRGFLDNNIHYLGERLRQLQSKAGKGKFHSFYRHFLRRLFHEGLGQSKPRGAELDTLLGDIPYLNGGLFDVHELEEAYPNIDIPDEAFERLFKFFDAYDWHLDDRPLSGGSEINPDVLGYIFEKYINQKQMGAYYTKEDITGYIAQSTIIPFLLERAKERCKVAFDGDASVWSLLAIYPDRYIHPAQRRGVVDRTSTVIPESALPKAIQAGIRAPSTRLFDKTYNISKATWQTPEGDDGILPTETWREYVERRRRCLAVRDKMQAGQVRTADDLVTLNLDSRQFMQDIVEQHAGPELLRAVWQAIVGRPPEKPTEHYKHGLSVLDPTCGSGAFLFAALNVLEPIYEACIERMEDLVNEADKAGKHDALTDFRQVLAEVNRHPSRRYFIYKSIVVHNLFGVDIMAEAVEICKLRLFLKLVSQVESVRQLEPLPDIDFNIRPGNTLVGYASLEQLRASVNLASDRKHLKEVEDGAENLAEAFDRFREQQTKHGGRVTAADKRTLRQRLSRLAMELDRFLAVEYGRDPDKERLFSEWRASHQPFHWFAEFYGVMREGGFDVVIGNPPYVEVPDDLSRDILKKSFRTALEKWSRDEDLYTFVTERSFSILKACGAFGMILPLSLAFSTKRSYVALRQELMKEKGRWWWSHYDRIPSALFGNDVRTRCTIAILRRQPGLDSWKGETTALLRWTSEQRDLLFPTLHYASVGSSIVDGIPKLASEPQAQAYAQLFKAGRKLESDLRTSISFSALAEAAPKFPKKAVFVGGVAYNWFPAWREIPRTTTAQGNASVPARTAGFQFKTDADADAVFAMLCSSLGYWWWAVASDGFNLKRWLIDRFPLSLASLSAEGLKELAELGADLREKLSACYVYKDNRGRIGNFYLPKCQPTVDKIDACLAKHVTGLNEAVMQDIRDFNSSFSTSEASDDEDDDE
jgi:type I restriction-modification system DNA methylase subunit